jgi:hypothetical protein
MSSPKYIRSMLNIVPTPEDKGLEFEIKVRIMDNGLIMINTNPCGNANGEITPHAAVSACRVLNQMMEEALAQHAFRVGSGKTAA